MILKLQPSLASVEYYFLGPAQPYRFSLNDSFNPPCEYEAGIAYVLDVINTDVLILNQG